jgi:hypothetical protein
MVVAKELAPAIQDLAQNRLSLGTEGQVAEHVAPIAHQGQRSQRFAGEFSGQEYGPFKKLAGVNNLALGLQHQAKVIQGVRHFVLACAGILLQHGQRDAQVGFGASEFAARAADVTAFAMSLGKGDAAGAIDALAAEVLAF